MLKIQYRYPGDPLDEAVLMFGAEFAAANPAREIIIGDEHIPVDEIICDACNAEVGDLDPCCLTPGRLYCWECFAKWVKPHIVVGGPHDHQIHTNR